MGIFCPEFRSVLNPLPHYLPPLPPVPNSNKHGSTQSSSIFSLLLLPGGISHTIMNRERGRERERERGRGGRERGRGRERERGGEGGGREREGAKWEWGKRGHEEKGFRGNGNGEE